MISEPKSLEAGYLHLNCTIKIESKKISELQVLPQELEKDVQSEGVDAHRRDVGRRPSFLRREPEFCRVHFLQLNRSWKEEKETDEKDRERGPQTIASNSWPFGFSEKRTTRPNLSNFMSPKSDARLLIMRFKTCKFVKGMKITHPKLSLSLHVPVDHGHA